MSHRPRLEDKMGKVKEWLMGMEEDAMTMDRDAWIEKHGESNVHIYDRVNDEIANELALHQLLSLQDFIYGKQVS